MAVSAKTFLSFHDFLARIPGLRSTHALLTRRHGVIIPDKEVFGLRFRTPLGLGSDLDRNGEHINMLSSFGFGHVCAGPLTLLPQENDEEAPNKGIRHALDRIQAHPPKGLTALDITAGHACTDDESIARDILTSFCLGYDFADFFILDFRPSWIRSLLDPSLVEGILDPVLVARLSYDAYKPVLLRLPDGISVQMLDEIVTFCRMNGVDGIVLSDREAVRHVALTSLGRFPVIAADLVTKATDVRELLAEGADLVEISSAFVSGGGALVNGIYKTLEQKKQ